MPYRSAALHRLCIFTLLALVGASPELQAQSRPVVLEEVATIVPPGPDDQLTAGVALSGEDLLAAWRRNFDSPQGFWTEQAAHMFRRQPDGTWRLLSTLATTSSPWAGSNSIRVAMKGNVAAVYADRLRIFERTTSGWQQTADLGVFTILKLEMDAGTVVALGEGCSWRAFRKQSAGWQQVASVGTTAQCGPSGFGQDIDISVSTVVTANPYYGLPPDNPWSSRARIYPGLSSTPTYVTDPFLETGQPFVPFADSVAVEQGTVFAGRAGQVLAFERGADGLWRHRASAEPPDAFAMNVTDVQAAGLVAVGVDDASRSSGGVRLFQRQTSGTYREAARLYLKDLVGPTQLGGYVQVEGRRVVASSLRAAHVFQLPENLQAPALFQDTFGDGNANGWTASTNTWSVHAGESFVYRQSDVNALNTRSIRTGLVWSNQSVEATVTPTRFATSDRWFGVIARYTDESNYYYLSIRNTNQVLLRRKRNGVFTTIDQAPLQVVTNRPYRVRIEAIGTRIRGYVDGERLVEAVDSSLGTGSPGLITYGATADFDTVVVTPSPLTTLFADDFDSQSINPHWQVLSGDWNHIINVDPVTSRIIGSYRQSLSQGYGRVLGGVNTFDQVIEADATRPSLSSGAWYGLIARHVSDGNFYCLCVQDDNRISIQRFLNGSPVILDSATVAISPNTWRRFRFEVLGGSLRGYVDGRVALQASDRSHGAGRYGLVTFNTPAEFDNVLATQP
jgi:hypothetical protein